MKIIPNTSNIEILTPDGFKPFSALSISNAENGRKFTLDDDSTIRVSISHQFLVDGQETLAAELSVGDYIDAIGSKKKIIAIEEETDRIHIGPLNVDGHLYLTPNKVVNHNCQFIGSTTTLIDPVALDKLVFSEPVSMKYGYSMYVYQEPVEGGFYMLGVDSAAGSGKDYSVIQVIRIYGRDHFEQVAVYADNMVPVGKFASVLKEISEWYNDAPAIVENNEIGKTVADEAWYTLNYQGIINTDDKGIGTRATKTSKVEACLTLKKFIDEGKLVLHDRITINELSIFAEIAPGIFKAPKGKHDDHVSGLYWACYGIIQPNIDLDNLEANKQKEFTEEVPDTFWGDSTDGEEDSFNFNWL